MTLVGIAPATNIALALMTEPALAAKVERIVLMTGAWGEGNATPAAEFNALNDPEALAVILACGRPVVAGDAGTDGAGIVHAGTARGVARGGTGELRARAVRYPGNGAAGA